MRTLVTGATGLIGRALIERLDSAVVLSRDPEHARRRLPAVEAHPWSAEAEPPPAAALSGAEVVFNLAGEPVAEGRWTAEKKRRIRVVCVRTEIVLNAVAETIKAKSSSGQNHRIEEGATYLPDFLHFENALLRLGARS